MVLYLCGASSAVNFTRVSGKGFVSPVRLSTAENRGEVATAELFLADKGIRCTTRAHGM